MPTCCLARYLIFIAGIFVLVGHVGGTPQGGVSSTLLQLLVEEQFRGGVFAVEMAMLTLIMSLSTLATGQALDAGFSPWSIVVVLALPFMVPGSFW